MPEFGSKREKGDTVQLHGKDAVLDHPFFAEQDAGLRSGNPHDASN